MSLGPELPLAGPELRGEPDRTIQNSVHKFLRRQRQNSAQRFWRTEANFGARFGAQNSVRGIRCTKFGARNSMHKIRCTKFGVRSSVRKIRCTKFGAQNSVRELQKLSLRGQTLSKGRKQQLPKAVTIPGGAGDEVSDGNRDHVNASFQKIYFKVRLTGFS